MSSYSKVSGKTQPFAIFGYHKSKSLQFISLVIIAFLDLSILILISRPSPSSVVVDCSTQSSLQVESHHVHSLLHCFRGPILLDQFTDNPDLPLRFIDHRFLDFHLVVESSHDGPHFEHGGSAAHRRQVIVLDPDVLVDQFI